MKYAQEYNGFFKQSEAGQSFVKWIEKQIDACHRDSEKSPETASQNAAGARKLREVLEHIDISTLKGGSGE